MKKLILAAATAFLCACMFSSCKSVHKIQDYSHAKKDSVVKNDIRDSRIAKVDSTVIKVIDTSSSNVMTVEFDSTGLWTADTTISFGDDVKAVWGNNPITKVIAEQIAKGKLKPKSITIKSTQNKVVTNTTTVNKSDSASKVDKTKTTVKTDQVASHKEVKRFKIPVFAVTICCCIVLFIFLFLFNRKFRDKITSWFSAGKHWLLKLLTGF